MCSYAVASDSTDCATALLDCGADTEIMDFEGRTALSYAIVKGSLPMVELLVSLGSNLVHSDNEDAAPLKLASEMLDSSGRGNSESNDRAFAILQAVQRGLSAYPRNLLALLS